MQAQQQQQSQTTAAARLEADMTPTTVATAAAAAAASTCITRPPELATAQQQLPSPNATTLNNLQKALPSLTDEHFIWIDAEVVLELHQRRRRLCGNHDKQRESLEQQKILAAAMVQRHFHAAKSILESSSSSSLLAASSSSSGRSSNSTSTALSSSWTALLSGPLEAFQNLLQSLTNAQFEKMTSAVAQEGNRRDCLATEKEKKKKSPPISHKSQEYYQSQREILQARRQGLLDSIHSNLDSIIRLTTTTTEKNKMTTTSIGETEKEDDESSITTASAAAATAAATAYDHEDDGGQEKNKKIAGITQETESIHVAPYCCDQQDGHKEDDSSGADVEDDKEDQEIMATESNSTTKIDNGDQQQHQPSTEDHDRADDESTNDYEVDDRQHLLEGEDMAIENTAHSNSIDGEQQQQSLSLSPAADHGTGVNDAEKGSHDDVVDQAKDNVAVDKTATNRAAVVTDAHDGIFENEDIGHHDDEEEEEEMVAETAGNGHSVGEKKTPPACYYVTDEKLLLEGALPPAECCVVAGKANDNDGKVDDGEEEDLVNSNLDECEDDDQDKKMVAKNMTADDGSDVAEKKAAVKDYQCSQEDDSKNRQEAHAAAMATNDGTMTATSTPSSTAAAPATTSNNNNNKKRPPPPISLECEEHNNKKKPKKAVPHDALQLDSDGAAAAEEGGGTTALTSFSPSSSRRSSRRQRREKVQYDPSATCVVAGADASKRVSRRRKGKPSISKKSTPAPERSPKNKRTPALASNSPTEERPPTAEWQNSFQQLVQFKAKHGHVEVSKSGENKMLVWWCSRQRRCFANRHSMATTGEKKHPVESVMTDRQLSLLNLVGFRFLPAAQLSFAQRVDQLSTYKFMHGHCRVPQSYSGNDNLGAWVNHKRTQYRRNMLSPDHVSKLESLGFEWYPRQKKRNATASVRSVEEGEYSSHQEEDAVEI